ncbi:PAS domain S-box protein [Aerosakkonemataceae cyanobacterium BLCC-F154]|uniref:histidine kinase n=1 Tax=Floridaenema fluviatile BLCC-F154 TaxID=3153640 RepID=A0ABV4YJM5_9CYAN
MRSATFPNKVFQYYQQISLHFVLIASLLLQIAFWLTVVLVIPLSGFLDQVNQNVEKAIWLFVIAGISITTGEFIIAYWVTKQILKLKISAQKIANGDWEQTIKVVGVREIKNLADYFNSMAKQLQILLADLMNLNTDLSQNERRLIQFLEALPLGLSVQDTEGSIVYHNQIAKHLTGKQLIPYVSIDEFTATYEIYQAGTNQLYPTEQLPFMRALRGEVVAVEDVEIRNNGTAIPLEVHAQPIFDDQGNIIHAIITFQDISERKKAEKVLADYNHTLETQIAERTQALRESEDRFQAFMNNSPFTAFIKDETGKLIYINRQTVQYGNKVVEPLGKTSLEIFPPLVAREIDANDLSVMATGKATEFVETIPNELGKKIDWLAIKFPLYDGKGNKFLGGIAVDISDRLRLEQELANSQAKLNDILNNASASISSFRIYQNYTWEAEYYSSGCETVFGYKAEELIADKQLWVSRILPEDWQTVIIPCFQGIFNQCNQTVEYRFLHKDNSWRWIRAVFTSRRDENANCWIMISVDTDITERKEIEQQLQAVSDELEHRVGQRTAELAETNQLLKREIQERKQAEEELSRSEELYRNLVELQTDVIVRIDLAGNLTFANRSACQSFGFEMPEFIGESLIQFAHPDDLKDVLSNMEALKLPPYHLTTKEQRGFTVNGIRWLQWDIAAIRNEAGEVIELQAVGRDITNRKQAEEALAASQRFIETIADTIPNLLYIIDPIQKSFVYLNKQYAKFFGRSTEEIKQATSFFTEVTHPEDLIKIFEICERLNQADDEEIVENEFRVRNADGEWRWLHTRDIIFSRTADGLPEQILGTAIDVTVAKKLEEARMQAEQQIHFQASLLDAVHQAVIVTDLSGTIIYWNRYAETMYGWTAEEAVGNSIVEFVPAPSLQQQASEIMTQLLSGNSWSGEFWVQRKDGTVFPSIVIDSPIYNEQRELTGIIGVSIDISDRVLAEEELKRTKAQLEVRVAQRTAELIIANRQLQHELNQRQQAEIALQEELLERKRAEVALQQSEALFRSLSESAPIGIFKTDAEGNCIYANPRCQPISGISVEEGLGSGWMQSIHPDDLNNVLAQWRETTAEQQEFAIEIRYFHRDGTVRFGRTKIAPIISETGETIGQVGTIEDITDSRAIEQMKSEFISIVSHELRTPLASIRGSLGLVAAGVLDDDAEAAKQMLEIAAIEADRVVRLVNDILDLERLELNKVTLDRQWCDAYTLMQQSVQALRHLAEENQITLQLEPLSIQIWADRDRIIQTLVNLLSNAIKFSPPESTVTISAQEQSDRILFQVQDCGRGIPTEKLETIFGRFQQVDASDSRTKGGTGLGLAICRNIVQQHGGRIWVESVLGEGSTFYFTLPIPWE